VNKFVKLIRQMPKQKLIRLVLPYGLILVFGLAALIYQYFRPGKADTTTIINNVATVQFCTEGDGCDPTKSYTGFAASNTVALSWLIPSSSSSPTPVTPSSATPTTVTSPSTSPIASIQSTSPRPTASTTTEPALSSAGTSQAISLKLTLEGRSDNNYQLNEVKVTVHDAQSGQEVISQNVNLASSGEVTIPGSLDPAKTYKVTIKAPGYLSTTSDAKSNVTVAPSALVIGDFDGDDKVTIADVVSVIAAHNGATRPSVIAAFGKAPDIASIVQVIRNSNNSH
jgi:hypothetical protein